MVCKKIGICGAFDESGKKLGGQVDRTKIIIEELKQRGYCDELNILNIENHRNNFIYLSFKAIKLFFYSKKIIYIVSRRGNLFFTILYGMLNLFIKRERYCVVIGCPPVDFFKNHTLFWYFFKKLDGSFYEIEELALKMKLFGCKETFFFPNCKLIQSDNDKEIMQRNFKEPFPVCTYSRITEEKGIADAIFAVKNVNMQLGETVFQLDIYGSINSEFKEKFYELLKDEKNIAYKGRVKREESRKVLQEYYLMLFPTHHHGEGVPGGIIDALEAGLPVITTDVSYNYFLVKDGKTGRVYQEDSMNALESILLDSVQNSEKYISMRENCITEAKKYDVNTCLTNFIKCIS